MPRLYLETNFLMGLVKGQDPEARQLISGPLPVPVVLPGVCFMETLSRFEGDAKQWRRAKEQLNSLLREARRDLESSRASTLAHHLQQSLLEGEELQNDLRKRLADITLWLAGHGELISLDSNSMRDFVEKRLLPDPTDNLILHSIMQHSRSNPDAPCAFVSANFQDFDEPEVL